MTCILQGIECHFLEAWHQKLHTNTTQEDITVCEAYIAFLESGDVGTYSRVLWENGGISREDMANKWDRKIPGGNALGVVLWLLAVYNAAHRQSSRHKYIYY